MINEEQRVKQMRRQENREEQRVKQMRTQENVACTQVVFLVQFCMDFDF